MTFIKKTWAAFATLARPERGNVSVDALVNLTVYRKEERITACKGHDPIIALPVYAQDSLIFREGRMVEVTPEVYRNTPDDEKVNKFGHAYRAGAPLLLHRTLADIFVDAAMDMHRNHGWTTVAVDGLRTMEAGYVMYANARPEWLRDKLLSSPGSSAHNRGLAIDSFMLDASGREVEMGAHFDHSDMEINHRNYSGAGISAKARKNRLIREAAMLRAAFALGTVIAPLREEFWDDRMPGSQKDLWRVIESICRVTEQETPQARAEDYSAFTGQWQAFDKKKMIAHFGEAALNASPLANIIFHESLNPIYDRDLPRELRLTDRDLV